MSTKETDRLRNKRAANQAEYDEAVRMIQWFRARAIGAREGGNEARAIHIAVACSGLESVFLLPSEP